MKQICGDCLHYNACAAWNIGSLANTEAGGCVNFEHYHLYDAVEVVRCKDCGFWYVPKLANGEKLGACGWWSGNALVRSTRAEDYCSRGVCKEG